MQRGSPPISPFAAIANIEKFDLTTSFFSSLLGVGSIWLTVTSMSGGDFEMWECTIL